MELFCYANSSLSIGNPLITIGDIKRCYLYCLVEYTFCLKILNFIHDWIAYPCNTVYVVRRGIFLI